ncbi:DUF6356 family protein [Sphingomonas sp. DT-204]|uniref:DUF6356 family protein n=1 Tax=Sphingomonas sp. DT-204 TaxID=3396166 RepID=UPI003F1CA872
MANPLHRWFVEHPQSVGESYIEHFGVASRFGLTMVAGGLACFVHALVPALCTRTGSSAVKRLYSEMVSRQPGARRPAYEEPHWRPEYEI